MVENEPAEDPVSTSGNQGRGRFFPTKPPGDELEFADQIPGCLGMIVRVIANALWLMGAFVIVYQLVQWLRH
jgi:hypothetical protein